MSFDFEKLCKKMDEIDWLAQARAPLVTLEDCYDVIDIWPQHHANLVEIQRAYRHLLYKYNPNKVGLQAEAVEYRTLMKAKAIEAYKRVCEALGEDPEQGLDETEESLIAERDKLIAAWDGHWCGTPMMNIQEEYGERIKVLRDQRKNDDDSC